MNRWRAALAALRRAHDECRYAQTRVLEIQTGQALCPETRARQAREEIEFLKTLFTVEAVSCSPDGERDHGVDAPHQDRRDHWSRLEGA